jgi:hypothetical protein
MIYHYKVINSPVGFLKLVATDEGLAAILWEKDDPKRVQLSPLAKITITRSSSKPSDSSVNILQANGRSFL